MRFSCVQPRERQTYRDASMPDWRLRTIDNLTPTVRGWSMGSIIILHVKVKPTVYAVIYLPGFALVCLRTWWVLWKWQNRTALFWQGGLEHCAVSFLICWKSWHPRLVHRRYYRLLFFRWFCRPVGHDQLALMWAALCEWWMALGKYFVPQTHSLSDLHSRSNHNM